MIYFEFLLKHPIKLLYVFCCLTNHILGTITMRCKFRIKEANHGFKTWGMIDLP